MGIINRNGALYMSTGIDNSGLYSGLNKAEGRIDQFGNHISSVGDKIAKLTGIGFGVAGLKAFGQEIINVTGEMQMLESSFEVLLGGKGVSGFMAEMKQFAVDSPLSLTHVGDAAQMLLAFGVEADSVMSTVKQLGDVSMGNSSKFQSLALAYSQMTSAGKVLSQDLRQMATAGFNPLGEIARTTGKSIQEVTAQMNNGQITVKQVAGAFASATAEGGKFYGMTQKQAEGIKGLQAQLEGGLQDAFNEIGKSQEGLIAGGYKAAISLVENYATVGKALMALVATYGAYKAAVIAVNFVMKEQAAVNAMVAASNGVFSKSLAYQWVWTGRVQKAQALLNKTMLANPYVLAGMALVGLGYAIYKVATYQTEAEKAQTRLNDTMKESEKASLAETRELAKLKGELSATKKNTDEYNTVKEKIIKSYGKYHEGLKKEIEDVGLLESTYTKLTKAIQKSFGARQYEKFAQEESDRLDDVMSENLGEIQDRLIDKLGDEAAAKYYSKIRQAILEGNVSVSNGFKAEGLDRETQAALDKISGKASNDWVQNFAIEGYIKNIIEAQKLTDEIDEKARNKFGIDESSTEQGDTPAVFKFIGKPEQIKAAQDAVSKLKDELKGLNKGLKPKDASDGEQFDFSKGIEDKAKALKEAEDKLNLLLYGKSTSDLGKGESAAEKSKKEADKLADELLKIQQDNQQAALDLMDDNEETRLSRIELNYNREIALIKKKEKEWSEAQKGKLTEDQSKAITEAIEKTEQKRQKSTTDGDKEGIATLLKSKVEYLKEYGSFQQKKLAIAEEYAKKIKKAEEEGDKFDAARLKKQQQADVAAVEITAIKAEIDWQSVFGDLGMILEDQLKPTLERLKKYAKSDEFNSASVEDKRIIYDAINRLEKQTSGGLNKKMFSDVAADMQRYRDSLNSLILAKDHEEKAVNDLTKANEKLAKAQKSKDGVAPAQAEVANAQLVLDQAAESVINMTNENNSHSESLKSSSTSAINSMRNLEDGLNQLSSGSLKSALSGLGKVGETVGGKVGDSLAKALSGKGLIAEIIAAVVGILDILKEGVGTLVSGLIDSVLNAVDGILDNILSGKLFEQIGVSLFKGVRNIVDTTTFGILNSHGNSKEVNSLIDKLTNSNKYLITAIEKLTGEMSKSGGKKSTEYYESAKNKQEQKIENDRQMLEAKQRYTNSHRSNNYNINKAFNADDWKKASDYVGKKLESAGDLWKLSPEDLAKLQELPDIWSKINAGKYNNSDWLNAYVSDANTLLELTQQWQDAITDTSFDNIRSEMRSLLADFKLTSEDAIASVDDFLTNAILNSIVNGTYSDMLKKWQEEFAKAMKDGILDGDEADYLRTKYQDIFDQAMIDRDAAYEAAGIDGDKDKTSQSASRGGFETMSQDTGKALEGRFTALQMTGISMDSKLGIMQANSTESLLAIKNYGATFVEMRNIALQSMSYLESIAKHTKVLPDMASDISEVKRNTSDL